MKTECENVFYGVAFNLLYYKYRNNILTLDYIQTLDLSFYFLILIANYIVNITFNSSSRYFLYLTKIPAL